MSLTAGARLGPYEVVDLLGAGGMGEVYRARDPRLGREVAVKILPAELATDSVRLRRFEQEARAVAALNHPHILTVFDVGSHDGTPYVVTELLEGETLREVLARRSPTLPQLLTFAVQAAQGLAAAHQKGIIHRDLKPENLFLTTDGRVKILDFGLARIVPSVPVDTPQDDLTRPGTVVGTIAYMAPEQVKAFPVDPRSDLFSFGVVLYELLSRTHPFRRDTVTATLVAIVEETPPPPSTRNAEIPAALDRLVQRCIEKNREERFRSARELALALEAVLHAPAGATWLSELEERSPYPGLLSFTEKDAAVFFGREDEVKGLWRRIADRRLLAVIGPSGAGKTSFVRAGVVASRPAGWGAIVCSPGAAPMRSLGQALAPELAADPEALRRLLNFDDPEAAFELVARWRWANEEVLLVVDQFEELFTLSDQETQQRFATLLGRLARQAGLHVVLSLRDDFLIRCSEHEALAPVFESLTPLPALTPEGLRRALVEPAKKLGYGFEDDALVDEMIASVEGVRGALPLLAFAVARLWEGRDRERKLLTREAYQEIGGVAGALAQHAEAVMSRIGPERHAIVREIFRNLVTAQGTRAVVDRDELLSAFPEQEDVGSVLRELIAARLLTSYEVEEAEGQPSRHRVEVAHESLLKAWPRLVKWQAQDEEGAVLRDQLKQAARLWQEKSRTGDLLWTGTAYQEFQLWRGRYTGKLTAIEDDFARAMAEKARRKRRLVVTAATAAFLALAGVAVAIGILRYQAAKERDKAEAEALRAEAGKLLAIGRTEIDVDRTAALAYVRKSLELADTPEARRFAVEVLWRGPVARILDPETTVEGLEGRESGMWEKKPVLSAEGSWLALQNTATGRVVLFPQDGGPPLMLPRPPEGNAEALDFGPGSDTLVTNGPGASLRLVSLPDLREVRRFELGGAGSTGWVSNGELLTLTRITPDGRHQLLRSWPIPQGEPRILATLDTSGLTSWKLDRTGRWLVYVQDRTLYLRAVNASGGSSARILGRLPGELSIASSFEVLPGGRGVATMEKSGDVRLWWLAERAPPRTRLLRSAPSPGGSELVVDDDASHLACVRGLSGRTRLYDLLDPPDADAVVLNEPQSSQASYGTIERDGRWVVTSNSRRLRFWPTSSPWRRTLPLEGTAQLGLEFTPDSRWLASCPLDHPARLFPTNPSDGSFRDLSPPVSCYSVTTDPKSTYVLVTTWADHPHRRNDGGVLLYPVAGGAPRHLRTGWEGAMSTHPAAVDATGRRAMACLGESAYEPTIKDNLIRVWDLPSGSGRTYTRPGRGSGRLDQFCNDLAFSEDGRLISGGTGGVFRYAVPPDSGAVLSGETLFAAAAAGFAPSPDGRKLLILATNRDGFPIDYDEVVLFDLVERISRKITTHGEKLFTATFDSTGRIIVTGDHDGIVRAGSVTGEEPHLLLGGHSSWVQSVAVSADKRWIASAGEQGLFLWPMPDVTKPPLHTLPHAALLAKLDALTNLRVVRDPSASTGWKLDVGPFPGWKDVPSW